MLSQRSLAGRVQRALMTLVPPIRKDPPLYQKVEGMASGLKGSKLLGFAELLKEFELKIGPLMPIKRNLHNRVW